MLTQWIALDCQKIYAMIQSVKIILILATTVFSFAVRAQSSLTTAGGSIVGFGGSASYSIGQVFQNQLEGDDLLIGEGVLHSYVIAVVSGIEDKTISLSVFPNPTSDILKLSISEELNVLSYQLHDLNGRLTLFGDLHQNKEISMRSMASGTYLLSVLQKEAPIKIFKIIKN